jgi:hypothetical protein
MTASPAVPVRVRCLPCRGLIAVLRTGAGIENDRRRDSAYVRRHTWFLACSRLRGRCRAFSRAGGYRSRQRSGGLPAAVRGPELGPLAVGHVVPARRAAGPTSRRPAPRARPLPPPVGICHLPRCRSIRRLALVRHRSSSTRGSGRGHDREGAKNYTELLALRPVLETLEIVERHFRSIVPEHEL